MKKNIMILSIILSPNLNGSQEFIESTEVIEETKDSSQDSSKRKKYPKRYNTSQQIESHKKQKKVSQKNTFPKIKPSKKSSPLTQKNSTHDLDLELISSIMEMMRKHEFDAAQELIEKIENLTVKENIDKQFYKDYRESIPGKLEFITDLVEQYQEEGNTDINLYQGLLNDMEKLLNQKPFNKKEIEIKSTIPKHIKKLKTIINNLSKK